MRNIADVVDAIKRQIPDEYEQKNELVTSLDKVVTDSVYKAPEQQYQVFEEVSIALSIYLGNPDSPWKEKVAGIFSDKLDLDGNPKSTSTSSKSVISRKIVAGDKCRLCDIPKGSIIKVPEGDIVFHSLEKDTGGSYCTAEWIDKGSKAVSLSATTPLLSHGSYFEIIENI